MSAATQNEMERLRKERDEHEQARTALEEDLGQVILERDEAFARGKQVFEDLRRVEAERDEYRDLADKWREDWTAAMDQRDALAAHVEQQGDLLADSASWLDHAKVFISTRQKMHEAGREGVEECLLRIAESRSNAPTTSLAQRDARVAADAIEEALDALNYMAREVGSDRGAIDATRDELRSRLHDCRQQAAGGES